MRNCVVAILIQCVYLRSNYSNFLCDLCCSYCNTVGGFVFYLLKYCMRICAAVIVMLYVDLCSRPSYCNFICGFVL